MGRSLFLATAISALLILDANAWSNKPTMLSASVRSKSIKGRLGATVLRSSNDNEAVSLVWFTGFGDLRTRNHPGLALAAKASSAGPVVPLFLLDDDLHLKSKSEIELKRLHGALSDLHASLPGGLVVQSTSFNSNSMSAALVSAAAECAATLCVVPEDDVTHEARKAMRAACAALSECKQQGSEDLIALQRWSPGLRPCAPWESLSSEEMAVKQQHRCLFPTTYEVYETAARATPLAAPSSLSHDYEDKLLARLKEGASLLSNTSPLPSLEELLARAAACTPSSVLEARQQLNTLPPFVDGPLLTSGWAKGSTGAANHLDEYLSTNKDAFAEKHFGLSSGAPSLALPSPSLHAAAARWILESDPSISPPDPASSRLATREPATRAFAAPLALGTLSAPATAAAAAAAGDTITSATSRTVAAASALSDVIEWSEWHRLLARHDVEAAADGKEGASRYWRWHGEHLVRYRIWGDTNDDAIKTNGASSTNAEPVLVLVHGFGASSDQWERLVKSVTNPCRKGVWDKHGLHGPPSKIVALDLLGFGHSSKPGLTYTQHLWEAQVSDFIVEVLGAPSFVIAGNSIGGGLAAGVASNLKSFCRGLVLCNTAGNILGNGAEGGKEAVLDRSAALSMTARTLKGGGDTLGQYYAPPPLPPWLLKAFGLGSSDVLEGFGSGLIGFLKPRIPSLLKKYYPVYPGNADAALATSIARDASDPGAANVIGSGQKLPPQRPLDEVLGGVDTGGFAGPVLVPQGVLDPLAGPERTVLRLAQLQQLRPGITGVGLQAGHCPHDEAPDQVADAIASWWPQVLECQGQSSGYSDAEPRKVAAEASAEPAVASIAGAVA